VSAITIHILNAGTSKSRVEIDGGHGLPPAQLAHELALLSNTAALHANTAAADAEVDAAQDALHERQAELDRLSRVISGREAVKPGDYDVSHLLDEYLDDPDGVGRAFAGVRHVE